MIQNIQANIHSLEEHIPHAHSDAAVNSGHHPRQKLVGAFYFLMWFLWLLLGTLFYAYAPESDLGIWKGFFMAVNIGYSIGYGFPVENYTPYFWFSTVYVILGASLVAVALGFFADKMIEDADSWFTNIVQKKKFEEDSAPGKPLLKRLSAYVVFYKEFFRAVAIWIVWIGVMMMYTMVHVGWSFREAMYFAVSSCSTGGHYAIPNDSPDWLFAVTAFFVALGIPLMGSAMASIASLLINQGDLDAVKMTVAEEVTAEELAMMQKFGLEDGDGQIDRAEYIILCMVRMGTDPEAIEYCSNRFNELDVDKSGFLDFEEITGGKVRAIPSSTETAMSDLEQGKPQEPKLVSDDS